MTTIQPDIERELNRIQAVRGVKTTGKSNGTFATQERDETDVAHEYNRKWARFAMDRRGLDGSHAEATAPIIRAR